MRFVFLLLALFSFYAQAADYKWAVRGSTDPSAQFDDWKEACTAASLGNGGPFPTIGVAPNATNSDSIIYCLYERPGYSNGFYCLLDCYVRRVGDSCPPNTSWNSTTRRCEGDPCQTTIDEIIFHEHAFRNLSAEGEPDIDPPIAICKDACQYTHTFDSFTSQRDGNRPDQLLGSFKYKGNGVSCTVSPTNPSNFIQPPSKPPMSPQQTYFDNKTCDNWVTNSDGTSSRSCTTTKIFNEPGVLNCNATNSLFTCTVGTPAPNSNNTQAQQQTSVKLNQDGSKTTTTNTTTNTTTCKGLSKCSSTIKNETKVDNTNGDGSPGNSSSTCVGSGCKPQDDGKSGGGDPLDPDAPKDPEDDPISIPGPSRSLSKGEDGSFDDAHTQWDQKIQEATDELQSKVDQYANQFAGVFDLNLGAGGGSLPCERIPISFGTTSTTLDMCLNRFSEPLGYLRFAILLAATGFAALIILR